MGALLGLILPLVPSIVNGVESLFAKKPAAGTDKMAAVLQALRGIIEQFIAAKVPLPDGTTPTASPTDDALKGMVETVLAQMKTTGTLSADPAVPSTPAGNLFIVQGLVIPLRADSH